MTSLPDVIGQTIGEMVAGGIAGRGGRTLYAEDARADAERRYGPGAYYEAGEGGGYSNAAPRRSTGFFQAIGDFLGFDGSFGYNGPTYAPLSLANLGGAFSGNGPVDPDVIVVTGHRRDLPRIEPYMINSSGRVESSWMRNIQALGSQPQQMPSYEQLRAYEAATNPLLYNGPVDHMGQPLYGPSHYDAWEAFGHIMDDAGNVPLTDTLGRIWDWGNYRVPDAAQRAAARQAAAQEGALIDQLRSSPLAGAAYGISATLGADTEQRQAWANVGTIADGLALSASAARSGTSPAFLAAQQRPGVPLAAYMNDPSILQGRSLSSVLGNLEQVPANWRVERLGQGDARGTGWMVREYLPNGQPSGSMIRWHPAGSRYHFNGQPYWTVTNGRSNTPNERYESSGP
ncbi:MAG: hypothetical protein IT323_21290 [Anaerolineae bacterium]|nr:hypothetical protein [Anaerolineae bacterium]